MILPLRHVLPMKIIFFVFLGLAAGLALSAREASASPTVYIVPNKTTLNQGENSFFDVYINSEVTEIDVEKQIVRLSADSACPKKEWSYDYLVLATGISPIELNVSGSNHPWVSFFTHPNEAKALRKSLEANEIGRIAIIGAGNIGLELCEAFSSFWCVDVELIEKESQVLPQMLDSEMIQSVHSHLKEQGIHLHLGTKVTAIREQSSQLIVSLDDGDEISVDRVVLALGVRPNVSLLQRNRNIGVKLGKNGGILIDSHGRTSNPLIFATGDCAELPDVKGTRLLPSDSIANRIGRVVAHNIAGIEDAIPSLVSSAVVKVFDLNVGTCGRTVGLLRQQGVDIEEYWGAFPDRAHYYPESREVRMKMIRETDGKLLGIQVVSEGAVVRWINSFAQILDLVDGDPAALNRLEHAYSPPFATVLDPFHAFSSMIEQGTDIQLSPSVLYKGGEASWTLVNLLNPEERNRVNLSSFRGKIINMDLEELRQGYHLLPKKNVVTLCARGLRSYEAALFLRSKGIEARYIAGGIAFLC